MSESDAELVQACPYCGTTAIKSNARLGKEDPEKSWKCENPDCRRYFAEPELRKHEGNGTSRRGLAGKLAKIGEGSA